MNLLLIALLFPASLLLPPRTAMENPAVVSAVPQKLRKDYDKMWARFVAGKEDAKLGKDLDKFVQKQKTVDPAVVIQGYLALFKGDDTAAREKFAQTLTINPRNRIATFYLAELAYARGEYARAAGLYDQLLANGATYPETEIKRQKAFLLAIDSVLQAAARAEAENRLPEAEDYYRQVLKMAPGEPSVRSRLAGLLSRQNKKEEAEAEKQAAESLIPTPPHKSPAAEDAKATNLEDLGRWGSDIDSFRAIRDAEAVTREQLAVLMVRYFPQVTELLQKAQILTDIQNSHARSEIQTVVGLGIMDPRPNRRFEPEAPITRGEFAKGLARLSRLIGLSADQATPIAAPDVARTSAMYQDIQLVLGSGLMDLENSGSFGVSGRVSGREAVRSAERLVHGFQQAQR
jgi:tetratricopeptide (TPR) repeat protein